MNSRLTLRLARFAFSMAVLAQLILPGLHAQAWARQTGAPALAAFCGSLPANVAAQLYRELGQQAPGFNDSDDHTKSDKSCEACASVHTTPWISSSGGHWAFQPSQHTQPPLTRNSATPNVHLVHLPPMRAPPRPV